MVSCCLLLSTALFVVTRHPAIVNDVALVSPVASAFVALQYRRSRRRRRRHRRRRHRRRRRRRRHCRRRRRCRRGRQRGPVSGHETVLEDQLVLQN